MCPLPLPPLQFHSLHSIPPLSPSPSLPVTLFTRVSALGVPLIRSSIETHTLLPFYPSLVTLLSISPSLPHLADKAFHPAWHKRLTSPSHFRSQNPICSVKHNPRNMSQVPLSTCRYMGRVPSPPAGTWAEFPHTIPSGT